MGCLGSKEEGGGGGDGGAGGEFTNIQQEAPAKTVDPRLPFQTYRQLFNMKNSWKAVSRSMEKVAKDNLLLFLQKYPEHRALHKDLVKFGEDWDKLYESNAFEMAAVGVFNTVDFVMENTENVDAALKHLKIVANTHSKIEGFKPEYFKDMEATFMQAVGQHLGDRFTEASEENFRKLYQFVVDNMTQHMQG